MLPRQFIISLALMLPLASTAEVAGDMALPPESGDIPADTHDSAPSPTPFTAHDAAAQAQPPDTPTDKQQPLTDDIPQPEAPQTTTIDDIQTASPPVSDATSGAPDDQSRQPQAEASPAAISEELQPADRGAADAAQASQEQGGVSEPIPSASNPAPLPQTAGSVNESATPTSPEGASPPPTPAASDCVIPAPIEEESNLRPFHPELAEPAMELGNYAEAYYHWRPAAEQGDAEAQYGVGWMYHNGYGLAIDDAQALYWWNQAAEQGHAEATFSIAMLYNMGSGGVARDMDKAVEYYLRAASLGYEDARLVLRGLLGQGEKAVLRVVETMPPDEWASLGIPLQVRVRRANIRAEPHNQAAVITTLEQGHHLIELSRNNQWIRVGVTGLDNLGWIFQTLVEPASVNTADNNNQEPSQNQLPQPR